MDRTTANYTTILMPGSRRAFQNVNPPTVLNGTQIDATYETNFQEEAMAVLEGMGLAGNIALQNQLLQALRRLAGANLTSLVESSVGGAVTLTADNAGVVVVDATAGNMVITLPAVAAANGAVATVATSNSLAFTFVRLDTTANTVTIVPAGTDTVSPAGSSLALVSGAPMQLLGNGTSKWLSLAMSGWALLAGSPAQVFNVANAVAATEAVALGQFTRGGSTAIVLPAVAAAAGTVGSSGWTKDPSGLIKQWAYVQLVDENTTTGSTTWTFPVAFASGPLKFRATNCAPAAGQPIDSGGRPPQPGVAALVSYNATSSQWGCWNTGTAGSLSVFLLEAEGY